MILHRIMGPCSSASGRRNLPEYSTLDLRPHPDNRRYRQHLGAFTLVELCCSLAVISAASLWVAPSFGRLYERNLTTAQINALVTAVHFTRHAAVTHRTNTTLCPAARHATRCKGKWQNGLMVFTDANRDGRINGSDRLLQRFEPVNQSSRIIWRSFGNRQRLSMTPLGHTHYQNGTFTFCPNNTARSARQLVINVQGRARSVHNTRIHRPRC